MKTIKVSEATPLQLDWLVERDELASELARAQHHYKHYQNEWSEVCNENQVLINERDALMQAARLALDFVECCYGVLAGNKFGEDKRFKVEEALKKAGVTP